MKTLILAVLLCSITAAVSRCAQQPKEDQYIDRELAKINAHYIVALRAGKMAENERGSAFTVLGDYGWHKGLCKFHAHYTSCFFGAYTFSEERFQSVMRGERPKLSGGSDDPNTHFDPEATH
jgi:hypothetical protein